VWQHSTSGCSRSSHEPSHGHHVSGLNNLCRGCWQASPTMAVTPSASCRFLQRTGGTTGRSIATHDGFGFKTDLKLIASKLLCSQPNHQAKAVRILRANHQDGEGARPVARAFARHLHAPMCHAYPDQQPGRGGVRSTCHCQ